MGYDESARSEESLITCIRYEIVGINAMCTLLTVRLRRLQRGFGKKSAIEYACALGIPCIQ